MSTTIQNQSLQATMSQVNFDENDEIRSTYTEPRQTRSKTKMNRLTSSTNSMCPPLEKGKSQDKDNSGSISGQTYLDNDNTAKLELQQQELQKTQSAPVETIITKNSTQILSKRQRSTLHRQDLETPVSENNNDNHDNNDSNRDITRFTSTTIKKRKLRSNNLSSEVKNNKNDDDNEKHSNCSKSASGSIDVSLSEIKTTMEQQQTDLFSPVSPVPHSLVCGDSITFTTMSVNKVNNKEKDQESIEVGKQKNNGDDESKHSTSSMEWHSDTQSDHIDICKSDSASLNLNTKNATIDEHVQPVGFLKRVASYIFG